MPIHNADIAKSFEETADLLEIDNANPFRVRAYRNAARYIRGMRVPISELVDQGEDLTALPTIGTDLAGKISELVETGRCHALEKIRRQIPPSVKELLTIPGLGPKRVRALYQELDIQTLEQLERALRDGRIGLLQGFGEKMESMLLKAINTRQTKHARTKLALASQYARLLEEYLLSLPTVGRVTLAGSYRRCRETVGDLDIVVVAKEAATVMDHLVSYDDVNNIVSKGSKRATVILRGGLQVDVRVVAAESYGAALVYFTGSKAHNIHLRRLAKQKGLKINEYGVLRGKRKIAGKTEASVYRAVGLPWIAPELREDSGEIEAARQRKLPNLVEHSDLRGDLHVHTKATDGHASLQKMADAAQARGLHYLAITDHSQRLAVANGLDSNRLLRQVEKINKLNKELSGITLLKGIEVDILENGTLDLPDEVLSQLDLVIGAVHSHFHLSREKQTQRILRAMDNPNFNILAHPTGRLLDAREPYDVDMQKIVRHAHQRGCFLELNAHPERLDLLDSYCRMAKEEGVLVAISSDAHSECDFDNLIYGIGQARRGWLESKDVLNTRTLKQLKRLLNRGTKNQVGRVGTTEHGRSSTNTAA